MTLEAITYDDCVEAYLQWQDNLHSEERHAWMRKCMIAFAGMTPETFDRDRYNAVFDLVRRNLQLAADQAALPLPTPSTNDQPYHARFYGAINT